MQKEFIPHQKLIIENNKKKVSPVKKRDVVFGVGFITTSSKQTQKLGELLAQEISGGKIVCLSGDLGAGKTTFTQGLLKGLKVKGPYTSPTFVIMKKYRAAHNAQRIANNENALHATRSTLRDIYHIDAYRVGADDIISLGWEEIIADDKNIVIIEWAEKIKKIIPKSALWIKFSWIGEKERKITFKT